MTILAKIHANTIAGNELAIEFKPQSHTIRHGHHVKITIEYTIERVIFEPYTLAIELETEDLKHYNRQLIFEAIDDYCTGGA